MSESMDVRGQCLCGAVSVTAATSNPELRACHCEMCRRQNSFAFLNVQTEPESIVVNGPLTVFKSSEWAERAFCTTCGSMLWYGLQYNGERHLSAGLFPKLSGAMVQEYYVDECLFRNGFAGGHQKLTRQETIALFAPTEGDAR